MENENENREYEEETALERLADALIDSTELNAWEYGNMGNFLYN